MLVLECYKIFLLFNLIKKSFLACQTDTQVSPTHRGRSKSVDESSSGPNMIKRVSCEDPINENENESSSPEDNSSYVNGRVSLINSIVKCNQCGAHFESIEGK